MLGWQSQTKPPLGWPLRSDPHWSRNTLEAAWLSQQQNGGNTIFDVTRRYDGTPTGTYTWLQSEKGIVFNSQNAQQYIDVVSTLDTGDYSQWTWVFEFLMTTLPANEGNYDPWIINAWDSDHGSGNMYVAGPYRNGGVSKMRILANGGADFAESSIVLAANTWYTVATGYDGANIWIEVVGSELRVTDAANDPGSLAGTTIEIGGSSSQSNFGLIGYLNWIHLFSNTLPESALLSLKKDPYQMSEPLLKLSDYGFVAAGTTHQGISSDGLSMGETLSPGATLNVLATDGMGIGEATDGMGIGEVSAKIGTFPVISTDGMTLAEVLARGLNMPVTSADGMNMGETLARILSGSKTAADGLLMSDLSSVIVQFQLSVTDGILSGDAGSAIGTYPRTVTDGLVLSESLAVVASLVALVSDGITLSEDLTGDLTGLLEATATDGFQFGETLSPGATLLVSLSDQFNLGETVQRVLTTIGLATDGVTLSESVIGSVITAIIQALATDGINFGDTGSPVMTFTVTAADGVQFAETLATVLSFVATVTDGLSIGDAPAYAVEIASGRVTVTFQAKKAGIVFEIKKPKILLSNN
jgi:hypothetical protein